MSSPPHVALAEIAESVDYGVTASATTTPVGPKFLRITDIQNGRVDWDAVPWCQCSVDEASAARLVPGDIVFARTGATTGKSFLIKACPAGTVFASYLIRVRLGKAADPRYVAHFFKTSGYWSQVELNARGAAQAGVNATTLKSLRVPLPSLEEQRRIAEVLDRAEALRAKRRAALALLDTLTQTIFLDLFGDPAKNEHKWPVCRIGDLLTSATYGTSEKASATGAYPVLRMNNITRTGQIDLGELKYMDLAPEEQERFLCRAGDILFNRTNSVDLVGKTAIYRFEKPVAYAGYLIRLRVTADNHPEYVAGFLNTQFAKRVLRSMCKSIIGMANINASEVKGIQIGRPPLALQRSFASRVTGIERLKSIHRAASAKLDELFASLQHRAFRGEL
jgi:type I restriction enzyme, S subunit